MTLLLKVKFVNGFNMNADCKGALRAIDKSYKVFIHCGKSMTKAEVTAVLEYAISKGYDHTGELTHSEIEKVLNKLKNSQ